MNGPTAAIAKAKGPMVWLDMDQQQLDDAYDQLVYAPNRGQLAQRRLANSAAARARLGEPLRLAYGPTPIEALDVYRPLASKAAAGGALAPVAIFVHGGAWRSGTASEFTFLAEPFVRAGAISQCSILSVSTTPAAVYSRWSSRCAARSPGFIAMQKSSAATATGFF